MKLIPRDKQKKPNPPIQPQKPLKHIIIWLLIGLGVFYFYHVYQLARPPTEQLSYSEFIKYAHEGLIVKVGISGQEGKGLFRDGAAEKEFTVVLPPQLPDSALEVLSAAGVNLEYATPNRWSEVLIGLLPALLIVGLLWFLFSRQMRGVGKGALSFGKSRARLAKDMVKITFKDVAGVAEAKEEMEEIIAFLKDPKKFQRLGGRLPKGVILIGPPGTGKTLLAKAVAGEAGVPFFSISGSDFVEMFVGVGASRVRDMFEQGRRNAPCIIFLDEIDAVGRHRGSGLGGGHDEREQTLNQLLVEMDGFDTREGVILVAATNRPDVLDPALLRPGRFDRQIVLDLPDLVGREEILKVHSQSIVIDKSVDLKTIARGTPGFSGADLANLINEAALLAARKNMASVTLPELEEARDKVRWGRERRSRVIADEDKKVTAYHEAGHALVLCNLPEAEPLHKVTIIPRGIAYLGATMILPEKDIYHHFKKKILAQISGLFGGRAAEEIVFGDITAGARSDLKFASGLARQMVCEWGMSEKLGPMTFGEREEHLFLGREITRSVDYSEETARAIDKEISGLIEGCYRRAQEIVRDNRDKLEAVAKALLEYESLDGEEVKQILKTGVFSRPGRNLPEKDNLPKEESPDKEKRLDEEKPPKVEENGKQKKG